MSVSARPPGHASHSVLAAVLTPPDVVSQLMLAIPLLLLYEVTIIAIWFTDRKKADTEDAEEAAA